MKRIISLETETESQKRVTLMNTTLMNSSISSCKLEMAGIVSSFHKPQQKHPSLNCLKAID